MLTGVGGSAGKRTHPINRDLHRITDIIPERYYQFLGQGLREIRASLTLLEDLVRTSLNLSIYRWGKGEVGESIGGRNGQEAIARGHAYSPTGINSGGGGY